MERKIKNIVIYKSFDNGIEVIKSCVFYSDGTVKRGSYEDGITACTKVRKENNITASTMKEMMNKDTFYYLTEQEFRNNYFNFIEKSINDDIYQKTGRDDGIEKLIKVIEKERKNTDNNTDNVVSSYENFNVTEEDNNLVDEEEIIIDEEDNFYNRAGAKLREDNLGIKIGVLALGLTVWVLLWSHCNRKSKEGKIVDSNLPVPTPITAISENEVYGPTLNVNNEVNNTTIVYNNDLYNDYSFSELLNVTTNEFQKNSMINLSASLNTFNGNFADNYLEISNDIRAALSFDEVVALQQAYNTNSIDDIRTYFNGAEIHAEDLSSAYKDASLQLMGAYVIENSLNPVDMSILIDNAEGRAFYDRYHSMFLAAKEATGEEQIRLVDEFYNSIREDFAVTEEVRTNGISHSDSRNSLEDYQLSVTPIIAAAEILFQNLDVDNSLDDLQFDFINDIGLCNHADDKFERIETIMLSSYEDNENPLYVQYRNAIIKELQDRNQYVIDDSHRELANLYSFQIAVDRENYLLGTNFTMYEDSVYVDATTSYSEEISWEEVTTTTEVVTTTEEQAITAEAQAEVDSRITNENNEARRIAYEEAANEARRQQEIENSNAQNIANQIARESQQLQNDINNANNIINNNNSDNNTANDRVINESDFSGNVHFDNNHSDGNGNLDNSVQNITTDPSGANQTLPNPEDTEEEFNNRVAQRAYTAYSAYQGTQYVEMVDAAEGNAYIEYSDGYIPFDEDGNPIVVNSSESGYQYRR